MFKLTQAFHDEGAVIRFNRYYCDYAFGLAGRIEGQLTQRRPAWGYFKCIGTAVRPAVAMYIIILLRRCTGDYSGGQCHEGNEYNWRDDQDRCCFQRKHGSSCFTAKLISAAIFILIGMVIGLAAGFIMSLINHCHRRCISIRFQLRDR